MNLEWLLFTVLVLLILLPFSAYLVTKMGMLGFLRAKDRYKQLKIRNRQRHLRLLSDENLEDCAESNTSKPLK